MNLHVHESLAMFKASNSITFLSLFIVWSLLLSPLLFGSGKRRSTFLAEDLPGTWIGP